MHHNVSRMGTRAATRRWRLRGSAALVAAVAVTLVGATVAVAASTTGAGSPSRLHPHDAGAQNLFGVSIAVSGDTALVGATTADGGPGAGTGAVYVFAKGPHGWNQQAKLVAKDAAPKDNFGFSVALDGDTAVVGAPNKGGFFGGIGTAYVFERSGTRWTQRAELTGQCLGCGREGDFFGSSVGVSGNTALVGADGALAQAGAVFEFTRSGSNWTQTDLLSGSDTQQSDNFGTSISFAGGTAVIGAPRPAALAPGLAYVFRQSGTRFTQVTELRPSDSQDNDLFGHALALSGDTLLVGAPGCCGASNPDDLLRGAVDVFVRHHGAWSQQAELTANDGVGGADGDAFGSSVAVNADHAVVGAPFKDDFAGAAYDFTRTGTDWTQTARLATGHFAVNDMAGRAVGLTRGTAFVGAPQRNGFRGEVDVFRL